MKQKDIIIIVAIVIVSALFSYVLSSFIFGSQDDASKLLSAPKVEPISNDFAPFDGRYFSKDALNPTQTVTIGNALE